MFYFQLRIFNTRDKANTCNIYKIWSKYNSPLSSVEDNVNEPKLHTYILSFKMANVLSL